MSKLVDAMNRLESQWWAMSLVLLGLGPYLFCKLHNLPQDSIPQDLIVAGIALMRMTSRTSTTVVAPNANTQQVTTGADIASSPKEEE
jgi:hypothetical protein